MNICKRIAAVLGMAVGAGAVWLAAAMCRAFAGAPSFFHWGNWTDYAFLAMIALLGVAVFVVAYCFGFRWDAEPTTP
jgi:hypothetical protein